MHVWGTVSHTEFLTVTMNELRYASAQTLSLHIRSSEIQAQEFGCSQAAGLHTSNKVRAPFSWGKSIPCKFANENSSHKAITFSKAVHYV